MNKYILCKRVIAGRSVKNSEGKLMVSVKTLATLISEMRIKINCILQGHYSNAPVLQPREVQKILNFAEANKTSQAGLKKT